MTLTWDDFLTGEGNSSNGLPAGYKRVEWLESTGTQVIDTDIYPGDKDDGFDLKFVCPSLANIYSPLLSFATFDGSITERRGFGYEQNKSFLISSQVWTSFDINAVAEVTYIASCSRQYLDGIDTLVVNGEPINRKKVSPLDYPFANCGITYALFGQKTLYADGTRFTSFGAWRVFYCKMYIEGQLVRNFIPCLDPRGAPCMFDAVSKTTFYNAGTGDFSYPGQELEASTFSLRRPVTYAQLTAHGLRRLYRVPRGYNGTKEEYAAEYGFKPLVETSQPEEGYWSPQWRETAEEIVLDWVETEPPSDEFGLTNVEQEEIK